MDHPERHFPLTTPRIILRPLEPGEERLMVRFHVDNRKHLEKWEPRRPKDFYTVDYWKRFILFNERERRENRGFRLSVFLRDKQDGPIIGNCNLNNIVWGALQACHVGYNLDYRYEGQGLMHEALLETIRFAFSTLKLHRVMANHLPHNEKSAAVLKKLGFKQEGLALKYLKINGQWQDHVLTALINPAE